MSLKKRGRVVQDKVTKNTYGRRGVINKIISLIPTFSRPTFFLTSFSVLVILSGSENIMVSCIKNKNTSKRFSRVFPTGGLGESTNYPKISFFPLTRKNPP